MAIVDDYAGIAAELRRLRTDRAPDETRGGNGAMARTGDKAILDAQHPMRRTPAGDLLYRRLVSRRRR